MSDADPPALGTTELAAAAVHHLLRIVDRKASLLLKDRDASDTTCLHGFVSWLFEQIGARETQFRRKCMQLFVALSKHVVDGSSSGNAAADWMLDFVEAGSVDDVVAVVEPDSGTELPGSLTSGTSADNVLSWLSSVSTAMDAYSWLFQNNLLRPQQVFGFAVPADKASSKRGRGAGELSLGAASSSHSALLASLRHFLTTHLDDAVLLGRTAAASDVTAALTPTQLDTLHRQRAVFVCRLFSFLGVLFPPDATVGSDVVDALTLQGVLCPRLYRLVIESVISPATVALDTVDSQVRLILAVIAVVIDSLVGFLCLACHGCRLVGTFPSRQVDYAGVSPRAKAHFLPSTPDSWIKSNRFLCNQTMTFAALLTLGTV